MITASSIYAGITISRNVAGGSMDADQVMLVIRNGPSTQSAFDYTSAAELATNFGWEIFGSDTSDVSAFRTALFNIITTVRPSWSNLIPYGRGVLFRNLSENEIQCFRIANLVDSTDSSAVNWWDSCAKLIRREHEFDLTSRGRSAEQQSLQLEQELLRSTGLFPTWTALEDNFAGYDIESWRAGPDGWDSPMKHFIEVKSSVRECRFFLSRREWHYANRHSETWELHFWLANLNAPMIFRHADLLVHIPQEFGAGEWVSVKIDTSELTRELN